MAPLKGNTLGEKHRNYNKLLKDAIAKNPPNLQKINYDEGDIDNMIKIDLAALHRNVEYIMEVLKCDDMLYVTRAIKQSLWLITEQEYAHLINPEYLHSNVFPDMTAKAIARLMLHLRQHIKDEKRAEAFFTYVDKTNPKMASKWLQNCSYKFTEEILASRANIIPLEVLMRLCKKSIKFLELFITNVDQETYGHISLVNFTFLLKSHTEEFLNLTDHLNVWKFTRPMFNEKHTEILMKRCFQRVIDDFSCYHNRIHLSTFIKYLLRYSTDIESFLLLKCERCTLGFDGLKQFLDIIPQERILPFLRNKHGIQYTSDNNTDIERNEVENLFYAIEPKHRTFSQVYRWYEYAPFEVSFKNLQQYIYAETSAEERHSMLIVLLASTRKNMEHVKTVLQYYHDKHLNEPYIHKIRFVNSVLEQQDAFRFDEPTWNILNEIFHSLEVYMPSRNKVQKCVITIIIYVTLKNQPVQEIVEEKFTFDTLKVMQVKLNQIEQEKLFNYLYSHLTKKIDSQLYVKSETKMKQAVKLLENIWLLLKDWKKEVTHHQFVIDNIRHLSSSNIQFKWDIDMRNLYWSVKPYHSQLFENFMLLYPCEKMCMYALKHKPELLVRYKNEVMAACCNHGILLTILLSKLRIYWRESLANDWRNTFMLNIQNLNAHKALVKYIFALSSQSSLLNIIKKYTPGDHKIKWSEANEVEISLQKHIAKNMYLARPQLPVEVVLWYAKGDYLQYTLFSVNSIYSNMRFNDIQKHVKAVLNAPVSLQKNGIRLACNKIRSVEELLDTYTFIWKSTRNSSIRNVLIQYVSKLLRKSDNTSVEKVWKVLSFMIDDLNYTENKNIYVTLSYVDRVPLSVRGEYYQKCFLYLKNIPKRFNLRNIYHSLLVDAEHIIQYLDNDFVENCILISVYDIFSKHNLKPPFEFHIVRWKLRSILSAYLLCSKDENTQMQKYKNLFEPLFSQCVPKWRNKEFEFNVMESFKGILHFIAQDLQKYVFEMKMVMPVKMLASIQNVLETELCIEEQYGVITHWKLSVAYIKILNDIMIAKPDQFKDESSMREESVDKYSKICLEYLKEDITNHFPSIYMLFADAMHRTCKFFYIEELNLLNLLNGMLDCTVEQVYMLVLKMVPEVYIYSWNKDMANKIIDEIRKKIYSYPSTELKMHYFTKFSEKYDIEFNSDHEQVCESTSKHDNVTENYNRGSKNEEESWNDSSESKVDLSDDEIRGSC